MTDRDQTKMSMRNFIQIAREKGFSEDAILIAGVLAGSKEGHAVFSDTKSAMEKFSEICKASKDSHSFVKEILRLVKIN